MVAVLVKAYGLDGGEVGVAGAGLRVNQTEAVAILKGINLDFGVAVANIVSN